jgi:hypothetical protein
MAKYTIPKTKRNVKVRALDIFKNHPLIDLLAPVANNAADIIIIIPTMNVGIRSVFIAARIQESTEALITPSCHPALDPIIAAINNIMSI